MGNIVDKYRDVLEVGDRIENERIYAETALMLYNSDNYNQGENNARNTILTRLIYPKLLAHKLLSVRPEMVPTDTDRRALGAKLPEQIVNMKNMLEVSYGEKEEVAIFMKMISESFVSELNTRLLHHMMRNSITHKQTSHIEGVDLQEVNLVGESMGADFMFVNSRVADSIIDGYSEFTLSHSTDVTHGTHFIGKIDLPCGVLDVYENTYAPSDGILLGCNGGMIYRPHLVCNIEGNQAYSYDLVEEYKDKSYYHFFTVK